MATGLDAFHPFEVDYHRSLVRKNWPDFWFWSYSPKAPDGEAGVVCMLHVH